MVGCQTQWHNVMSHGPGRLTVSERVSWLGNKDFKVYITHSLFPICSLYNGKELGEPAFICLLVQRRRILLGFSLNNFLGG